MGERDCSIVSAEAVLPGAIEAGMEWMRRAKDAEMKLQFKTVEWSAAIEIARGYQLEIERLQKLLAGDGVDELDPPVSGGERLG